MAEPSRLFTKQEVLGHLYVRPRSLQDLSMAVDSGLPSDQVERENAESNKSQQRICDSFIERLEKLQIATEVSTAPSQPQTPAMARQNSSGQRQPTKTVDGYRLNHDFHTNMLEILTSK